VYSADITRLGYRQPHSRLCAKRLKRRFWTWSGRRQCQQCLEQREIRGSFKRKKRTL